MEETVQDEILSIN